MAELKTIILDGKEILYSLHRKNVKNINLRIKSDCTVSVSAHPSVPIQIIEEIMNKKADFILSALNKFEKKRKDTQGSPLYIDGECLQVLGKTVILRVTESKENSVLLADDGNSIILTVRDSTNYDLKKETIEKWQKKLCQNVVEEFCQKIYPLFEARGIPFPTLKFRTMRTRWGSCNKQKYSLNFNYELIKKEHAAIEYVVMHEFVHFIHPDHSKNFYTTLSSFMPDWKERKHML